MKIIDDCGKISWHDFMKGEIMKDAAVTISFKDGRFWATLDKEFYHEEIEWDEDLAHIQDKSFHGFGKSRMEALENLNHNMSGQIYFRMSEKKFVHSKFLWIFNSNRYEHGPAYLFPVFIP